MMGHSTRLEVYEAAWRYRSPTALLAKRRRRRAQVSRQIVLRQRRLPRDIFQALWDVAPADLLPTSHNRPKFGAVAIIHNVCAEPVSDPCHTAVAARGGTDNRVEVENGEAVFQQRSRDFDGQTKSSPMIG